MTKITKAGVIGAGVMGSGIAAHLANAGIEVVLLDIEKKFADGGVARQLKANGFMDKSFAGRITTGSTGDDMGLLADADWIVEAVAERLEIKQALYKAIDAVRKPGSIVSSNTSTIPLAALTDGLPESFAADFLITHFFNPPRIMRLLELVSGPKTRPDVTAKIHDFADRGLGKKILLVITGEFGRTPKINGNAGRDHWPKVFSVILAGGGIKQGIVYGSSNATASEPEENMLNVADWATTIYHCMGITADKELMAPGDRPIEIVKGGKVRKPLLA